MGNSKSKPSSAARFDQQGNDSDKIQKSFVLPSRNSTCSICEKIAAAVDKWNWDDRLAYLNTKEDLGTWRNYLESAKNCHTCNQITQLLSSTKWQQYEPTCSIQASLASDGSLSLGSGCSYSHEHGAIYLVPSHTWRPSTQNFVHVDQHHIDLDFLRKCISECDEKHQSQCHGFSGVDNFDPPPRMILIDVEQQCLVKISKPVKFVALSYVWGKAQDPFQTIKANLKDLCEPRSLDEHQARLPKTVQDAMTLTRELSIQYLWVDRFCIVQDDDEDKVEQISWMAAIYGNSYFTIIAASGPDAEYGLRGISNGTSPRNFQTSIYNFNGLKEFSLIPTETIDTWHTRAWTFQERRVSRRCVVFYQQSVKWECTTGCQYENIQNLKQSDEDFKRLPYTLRLQQWPDLEQYNQCVVSFSQRKLTYSGDALNAFTAVINTFSRSFPSGFLYGLPEFFIDLALLWTPLRASPRREGFPSWSWVGWEGPANSADSTIWHPSGARTSPVYKPAVQWFKMSADSGELVPVNSEWHRWQNYRFDGETEPPEGWYRRGLSSFGGYEYGHPRINEFGENLSSVGIMGCLYHPVPLQTTPLPINTGNWLPILYGRCQTKTYRIKSSLPLAETITSSDLPAAMIFHLVNSFRVSVGSVYSHDSAAKTYKPGTKCEVIAIAYGNCQDWRTLAAYDDVSSKSSSEDPDEWVEVLWIRWENGIAYRQGVGRILKLLWSQVRIVEKDIILG